MNSFLIPDNFVLRGDLKQENKIYRVPMESLRVWDAIASFLPTTSANDDLGISSGTFGTSNTTIVTSDMKTLGAVTRYARFTFLLPPEYVDGEAFTFAIKAKTSAVADTSSTIDVAIHESTGGSGYSGDKVSTAAQSINSASAAVKTFDVSGSSLVNGDVLDCRIAVAVNDAAGGSPVVVTISDIYFTLPVRG